MAIKQPIRKIFRKEEEGRVLGAIKTNNNNNKKTTNERDCVV
jgi:hypothetical protein